LPVSRSLDELGRMRSWFHRFVVAVGVVAAATPAWSAVETRVEVGPLVDRARRAGLRVIESRRLALVTDRPVRDGDGVESLPAIFDQAFDAWCEHYAIDADSLPEWRACGCLVVDRERFRAAGLLPDAIPEFANGFCDRNQFWMLDQSNPDYRRHLLLHEGVHAFTFTVRALAAPPWYTEGIAEYLATHRLDATPDGPRFVPTPVPARAGDVEQLGRIEQLRALRRAAHAPSLADIFALPARDHQAITDYAASWAAVVLLDQHPAHATAFAAAERGPLDAGLTARLRSQPGFDEPRARRDFDALTDGIDYGYDVHREAIEWSPGRPLTAPASTTVVAGRGWQNSGLQLVKGECYMLSAHGRCRLGAIAGTVIETEPDGISLEWYRGRPVGRLLAAQWVESPADGGRPRFVVLAEGAEGRLTADVNGPIYLRVNEPPGELSDDEGSFEVEIAALR